MVVGKEVARGLSFSIRSNFYGFMKNVGAQPHTP